MRVATSGYDSIQTNTVGVAFDRIKRDLTYIEITAADYKRAAAELMAANQALWRREEGKLGTRESTPEEIMQDEQLGRCAAVVFLRIDTLYFVGQRLLDGVVSAADTVLSPKQGRPRGVKDLGRHRDVKRVLKQRLNDGTAPPASAALLAAIDEVTPIKDYRDDYVAHAYLPPPTFPERRPTVRIGPERHDVSYRREPGPELTESVSDTLLRYVNTWLDYLETVPLPFDWQKVSLQDG